MAQKKSTKFTERHLVQLIVSDDRFSPAQLAEEFESSSGRADVIYFQLGSGWRSRMQYGSIPPRWLYALRLLPYRKVFTTDEFCGLAGVTRKTAARILKCYSVPGYCKEGAIRGEWTQIRQPRPVVRKIIAVEAKLHDWKRALSQAYRYLDYANQAWVALDGVNVRGAAASIEKFRRLNVGLYSMDRSGKSRSHFRPRTSMPRSAVRYWEANGQIAAALARKT